MVRPFFKSLDRQVDILGLRGKWITLFLVCAGASIILGVTVGFILTAGFGIGTVIFFIVLSFLLCMTMQSGIPSRRIDRVLFGKDPGRVVTRRETLTRILYKDEKYEKYVLSKKEVSHD